MSTCFHGAGEVLLRFPWFMGWFICTLQKVHPVSLIGLGHLSISLKLRSISEIMRLRTFCAFRSKTVHLKLTRVKDTLIPVCVCYVRFVKFNSEPHLTFNTTSYMILLSVTYSHFLFWLFVWLCYTRVPNQVVQWFEISNSIITMNEHFEPFYTTNPYNDRYARY